MSAILEIQGLSKFFRDPWTYRRFRVLDRLDFSVEQGEIFGLIGPNGAGKTTTFKLLLGLLRPSAGRVFFAGRPLDPHARATIGFLPEQPYFYDSLTVSETLDFYARLYGLSRSDRRSRVEETIRQVRLEHKRRASLRSLSKGTLQRVGIAQAILNRPRLVILDEPMSGLDPIGRRHMRDLIASLRRDGCAVIFSSHILPDAEALCDRIGILVDGQLRDTVTLQRGAVPDAYVMVVGDVDAAAVAALEQVAGGAAVAEGRTWLIRLGDPDRVRLALEVVHEKSGRIEAITPVQRSLEDQFLAHVGAVTHLD